MLKTYETAIFAHPYLSAVEERLVGSLASPFECFVTFCGQCP